MSELYLQAPLLAVGGGVRHGLFTRRGGGSGGPVGSLNCGFSSGDESDPGPRHRSRAPDALRLALTGTPVMNHADELIAQLRIIGRLEDFGSGARFARREWTERARRRSGGN